MNRKVQPSISHDIQLKLIKPETTEFKNGCRFFYFPDNKNEIIRLNFYIPAGAIYQNKPLQAFITSQMLLEGTSKLNNQEILDIFDTYGAQINISNTPELTIISIFSLNKFIPEIIPLVFDILTDSIFPEKAFKIHLENSLNQYLINREKVSFIARINFLKSIYTNESNYGIFPELEDYQKLKVDDVVEFYKNYQNFNQYIIAWTGKRNDEAFKLIEQYWGKTFSKIQQEFHLPENFLNKKINRISIERKDAKQSAIYIGKNVVHITDKDYHNLVFLNTLLGGFFGSRLMKNIREDKGYTYGIYSNITTQQFNSYLYISCEVKLDKTSDTITEIKNEIKKLQNSTITSEEIELVRNYLYGRLLRSIDGSFEQTDIYIKLLMHNINMTEYFENRLNSIKNITPVALNELAKQILNWAEMHISICGANIDLKNF